MELLDEKETEMMTVLFYRSLDFMLKFQNNSRKIFLLVEYFLGQESSKGDVSINYG